jgi:hydroxyacylglutathione hydrolase
VDKNGVTAAVDPAEPGKVLQAAKNEGLTVSQVLTTHHHWDHAGGNEEMSKLVPGLKIFGGEHDNVAGCTIPVKQGEEINVGAITVKCMETPFHTNGHICYLCRDDGSDEQLVFTGDTMFIGGCGRCFAGTPQQMYQSLIETLAKLPPSTKMYCGHEYTVANLTFAASADQDNEAVHRKLAWAKDQRAKNLPTIPSTIGEELQYNPFLRVRDPAIALIQAAAMRWTFLASCASVRTASRADELLEAGSPACAAKQTTSRVITSQC